VENCIGTDEVWEILRTMLPGEREQRLAFLLFHCGLVPGESVRFCPREWNSVQEIYRLWKTLPTCDSISPHFGMVSIYD
jgi:hypothetical protein